METFIILYVLFSLDLFSITVNSGDSKFYLKVFSVEIDVLDGIAHTYTRLALIVCPDLRGRGEGAARQITCKVINLIKV